eukprot:8442215-Pyramimonas_sp.AAC.1
MSEDLREGRLPRADKPELAKRMLQVLRDERSGICFRDLHGFNSTGSQVRVSVLPAGGGHRHLFSCASDPKRA